MKITVTKMTATQEQVAIELNVPSDKGRYDGDRLTDNLQLAFAVIDARLRETNRRILGAHKVAQTLSPEQQLVIRQVLDIIHGGPYASGGDPEPQVVEEARQQVAQEAAKLGVDDPLASAAV